MTRPRITARRLMALVLLAGLIFASMKNPSQLLASAVFTTTWIVLLASILCAFYHDGDKRYYWVGFAVFGSSHQFLAYRDAIGQAHARLLSNWVYIFGRTLIEDGFHDLVATFAEAVYFPEPLYRWDVFTSFTSIFIALGAGMITHALFVRRDEGRARYEEAP